MKRSWLIAILVVAALLSGCAPEENVEIIEDMPEVVVVNPTSYGGILYQEMLDEKALFNETRPVPVLDAKAHQIFEDIRPLAVMLDNHYLARPQSGLAQAKVVYEILAEGPITRYMMLVEPEGQFQIGPVRSARPYFIAYAMEFDALYAHAGGSEAGKAMIVEKDVDNLNGLKAGSGVFWRENHRSMPHNLYTSVKALYKDINRLKYPVESAQSWQTQQYDRFVPLEGGETAKAFKVTYKPPTSSDPVGYSVSYLYDDNSRLYKRSYNGTPQLDEATGERITAGSVIVIQVDHHVIDSAGRRELDIVGSGQGVYLTGGMQIPITWEKAGLSGATEFRDQSGELLVVNPGTLFIQVVEKMSRLAVEGE